MLTLCAVCMFNYIYIGIGTIKSMFQEKYLIVADVVDQAIYNF